MSRYESWMLEWLAVSVDIPVPRNPRLDTTGEFCHDAIRDDTLFLIRSGGGK